MTINARRIALPLVAILIMASFFVWTDVAVGQENKGPISAKKPFEATIQKSKDHFVCGGIGFIDFGVAYDGVAVYFHNTTRELISTCGYWQCMQNENMCKTLCPPPTWRAEGCDGKYQTWSSNRRVQRTPTSGAADAKR